MLTEIDVQERRAQAKAHRGVSYDARIDRFVAEIYAGGVRSWLGSYVTAEEAAEAYRRRASERERVAPPRNTFRMAYAAFRERHGGDRVEPPAGADLEYDGQVYRFCGLDWRKPGGGKTRAFYVWESRCRTCDTPFRTKTPAPVNAARGIARNCPQHATRKAPKPRDTTLRVSVEAKVAEALDGLSVVSAVVRVSVAVRAIADALGVNPTASEAFLRRWLERQEGLEDPDCLLLGDEICFLK